MSKCQATETPLIADWQRSPHIKKKKTQAEENGEKRLGGVPGMAACHQAGLAPAHRVLQNPGRGPAMLWTSMSYLAESRCCPVPPSLKMARVRIRYWPVGRKGREKERWETKMKEEEREGRPALFWLVKVQGSPPLTFSLRGRCHFCLGPRDWRYLPSTPGCLGRDALGRGGTTVLCSLRTILGQAGPGHVVACCAHTPCLPELGPDIHSRTVGAQGTEL
jgi:hypothetical protein